MTIINKIELSISRFEELNPGVDPRFIVLDFQSYFSLKEEVFGGTELAIQEELTEFMGLQVFYNMLGYNLVDVA